MGSKINERMITENPIDLLSIAELKEELKSYGLSLSGKKKELRARLKSGSKHAGMATKASKIYANANMKKAVELLLDSYWFGWDDGKPHIFDKMFDKYGTFVPSVGKASSMKGTPDKHTSKINLAAKGEGQTVKMLMMEGKLTLQEKLRTSPTLQEAFKDMTPQQVVALIEHDGEKFEFTKYKPDGSSYTYIWMGTKLEIPRWAIA